MATSAPGFLETPARSEKPRERGMTHVIDPATGLAEVADHLEGCSHLVDVVKLGWGTSYVDPRARRKVELLRGLGIRVSLGGTLFEASLRCGRLAELTAWARDLGVDVLEVSSGTLDIPTPRKLGLIEELAKSFTVLSEVGSKDVDIVMAPYRWVEAIRAELDAGAWKVVTEGRESGTAGLYRRNGEIRHGLVEEIVAAISPERVIFEAPQTHQQAWFVRTLGPEVNLGNVAWRDVIPLETLRLGLRGDTLLGLIPER